VLHLNCFLRPLGTRDALAFGLTSDAGLLICAGFFFLFPSVRTWTQWCLALRTLHSGLVCMLSRNFDVTKCVGVCAAGLQVR
jgi:hypothetical protein